MLTFLGLHEGDPYLWKPLFVFAALLLGGDHPMQLANESIGQLRPCILRGLRLLLTIANREEYTGVTFAVSQAFASVVTLNPKPLTLHP